MAYQPTTTYIPQDQLAAATAASAAAAAANNPLHASPSLSPPASGTPGQRTSPRTSPKPSHRSYASVSGFPSASASASAAPAARPFARHAHHASMAVPRHAPSASIGGAGAFGGGVGAGVGAGAGVYGSRFGTGASVEPSFGAGGGAGVPNAYGRSFGHARPASYAAPSSYANAAPGTSPYFSSSSNGPTYRAPSFGSGFGTTANSAATPHTGSGFLDEVQSHPMVEQLKTVSSKVEDVIDTYTHPLKPYIPALGRFLIVVTFLEDAIRVVSQWGDQLWYLQRHRHFYWGLSHLFLMINVVVMTAASIAVIARRYPAISVASLLGVIIAQTIGYGMMFDLTFFLRNMSVMGGLLMCLSDSLRSQRKTAHPILAGLPSLSPTDRNIYLQLAGRILLIGLFVGFIFHGEWSILRAITAVLGLGACIMVAIGFKARWSASFLVLLLSSFNLVVNNFWSVHSAHPSRDFLRYDFFQTLSIVGGLLLLVNMGPGQYSLDEAKKES